MKRKRMSKEDRDIRDSARRLKHLETAMRKAADLIKKGNEDVRVIAKVKGTRLVLAMTDPEVQLAELEKARKQGKDYMFDFSLLLDTACGNTCFEFYSDNEAKLVRFAVDDYS
jgi:hypothetical protein